MYRDARPKKDFRRGGSCPPPEVRHGLKPQTRIDYNFLEQSTTATIPLHQNGVNRRMGSISYAVLFHKHCISLDLQKTSPRAKAKEKRLHFSLVATPVPSARTLRLQFSALSRKQPMQRIDVSIGILLRDGQILICQRRSQDAFGELWEFPGGKCEPGESPAACLTRELLEELAVRVCADEFPFRNRT